MKITWYRLKHRVWIENERAQRKHPELDFTFFGTRTVTPKYQYLGMDENYVDRFSIIGPSVASLGTWEAFSYDEGRVIARVKTLKEAKQFCENYEAE